jgi:hypothetical protein
LKEAKNDKKNIERKRVAQKKGDTKGNLAGFNGRM